MSITVEEYAAAKAALIALVKLPESEFTNAAIKPLVDSMEEFDKKSGFLDADEAAEALVDTVELMWEERSIRGYSQGCDTKGWHLTVMGAFQTLEYKFPGGASDRRRIAELSKALDEVRALNVVLAVAA